ncbi:MAG: LPS-assembly protein LptD [Porticoccaceae bacterium]|nr:MAG: LPS-assembly protein LptD [Porticoccaceae bacterium]
MRAPPRPPWAPICLALISLMTATPGGASENWNCRVSEAGEWLCAPATAPTPTARAALAGEQPARVAPATPLDWVPAEQLPPELRSGLRASCRGRYLEPPRTHPDADRPPEEAPLRVSADESEARGGVAILRGEVQAFQGFRQMRSDLATVDRARRRVHLEGQVTYREPGFLLVAREAEVDLAARGLAAQGVSFVFHESGSRGEAALLERPGGSEVLRVVEGRYTTCEPGRETWFLRAREVEIDTETLMATARGVRLEVGEVPILYAPWIRFPVSDRRATGLLFPSILTGNDNGLDYAQPIYLNLAPNYDATLTPRLIQERGAMAEAEFRHLSPTTYTVLSGGWLPDDRGGRNNDRSTRGRERWTAHLDHRGGAGRPWWTRLDYTDVSDPDYFRDIDSASLAVSSASHLNQELAFGYRWAHWDLALRAQRFETLILGGLEQYRQLPRIEANGAWRLGDTDLLVELRQHYTFFDHPEDDRPGSGTALTRDVRGTAITGQRLRADWSLTWDRQWAFGFFRPRFTAKQLAYRLDDPLAGHRDENPRVLVPVVSADAGLFFERGWGEGWLQTLEPRLFYVHAPFERQDDIPAFDTSELTFSYAQLFREDRFSGADRIGDTHKVTLGLTTRLLDPSSGVERLRASIGQSRYLDDRRVTLFAGPAELERESSDIAAELSGQVAPNWRLQSDLIASDDGDRINKGSIGLHYDDGAGTLYNLGYRYTRRTTLAFGGDSPLRADIDQVDLSLVQPIGTSWALLGRYNYDLNSDQELEVFAGVEYTGCCFRVALIARRWVDRNDLLVPGAGDLKHNNGVFFEIQLRGLAGTGNRVASILRDGIYGYRERDD